MTDHARVRAGVEWSTQAKQVGKVKVTDPAAKSWEGWGTALKPAHEPIALARKPMKGSIARNCQQWGVGALNIDATRIPYVDDKDIKSAQFGRPSTDNHSYINTEAQQTRDNLDVVQANDKGRFPSNVIGEIPDYQKYFYCPKVSRAERHVGYVDLVKRGVVTETDKLEQMGGYFLDENNEKTNKSSKNIWLPQTGAIYAHGLNDEYQKWCKANGKTPNVGNNHPTVKPVELMKYLIKLITPPGGTVLDPFNGSGSTGCAAVELGHPYIGCELDDKYVTIAKTRIEAWHKQTHANTYAELFELC
jgi:site-specific DNA-methyltransferase (adenine-specific)